MKRAYKKLSTYWSGLKSENGGIKRCVSEIEKQVRQDEYKNGKARKV